MGIKLGRTIIAGGRDFIPNEEHIKYLIYLFEKNTNPSTIISGGARGADKFGEFMARELQIPLEIYEADWKTHGKSAGFIRNRIMAKRGDTLITYPGGRGTRNMIQLAEQYNLNRFKYPSFINKKVPKKEWENPNGQKT